MAKATQQAEITRQKTTSRLESELEAGHRDFSGHQKIYTFDHQTVYLQKRSSAKGEWSQTDLNYHTVDINIGPRFYSTYSVKGQSQTGLVLTGSVNLFPANQTYTFQWDRAITVLSLKLSTSLLSQSALSIFNTTEVDLIPVFAFQDPFIYHTVSILAKSSESDTLSNSVYVQSLIEALAVHLLRHFSVRQPQEIARNCPFSPETLEKITCYIQENLEQKLSLNKLSMLTHLSPYHFSRSFKQCLGISPHQYVIQQRIERAKALLEGSQMSIGEVAITCGFNHASHLSRHFKKKIGITPKDFIKRQQECD